MVGFSEGVWLATQSTPPGSAPAWTLKVSGLLALEERHKSSQNLLLEKSSKMIASFQGYLLIRLGCFFLKGQQIPLYFYLFFVLFFVLFSFRWNPSFSH